MTHLQEEMTEILAQRIEERFLQQMESLVARYETSERITEIFDASQPVDSTTGTPPLLSRVTERSGSREESESRTQASNLLSGLTEIDRNDVVDKAGGFFETKSTHNEMKSESRTEQRDAIVRSVLQIAAGSIISLFMIWLLLTLFKAIKSMFKIKSN